jgi:hypothetical protein
MPGLWRRALARGAQWRLLLLTVAALALPAVLGTLPVLSFLGGLLDRSTRARELVAALDSAGLMEIVRQLEADPAAAAIPSGLLAAAIASAALAPALGGAALTVACSEVPIDLRGLLQGAGEYYGRLLRMMVVALVPLALAGAVAAGGLRFARKLGENMVLEANARLTEWLAIALGAIVLLLAQVTLDAGRAHFAAQPERRSAFLAWWRGAVLLARHPVRVLGLCAVTFGLGQGLALLLLALRLHLPQTSAPMVAIAFVVGQLAVAAVAWDRASRLSGLTELVRADLVGRAQRRAAAEAAGFQMAPPLTSPPPPAPSPAPLSPAPLPGSVEVPDPETGS